MRFARAFTKTRVTALAVALSRGIPDAVAVAAAADAGVVANPAPAPSPSPAPLPPPGVIPLWGGGAPGSETKKYLPETLVGGNLASIHNPSLTVYLPDRSQATGDAVVVIPGGGHRIIVFDKEGATVARWLGAHGIAAFVLKYRLAREAGSSYRVEVEALADVLRAVRTVRSRAQTWGVDPRRVGVLGFSAGGELAALASMHANGGDPRATDPVERQSARPSFQALVYPGASQNIVAIKDSPPAFIVAGGDDRPDISEGVARVYLAFKQAGVPAELHVYAGVGHGFALRPGPASGWIARFADWLAEGRVPGASKP